MMYDELLMAYEVVSYEMKLEGEMTNHLLGQVTRLSFGL